MSTRWTLPELLQQIATECGPTLRNEDMAAAAAEVIRNYFAVMPRQIDKATL
ncbi:hypothetical protein [Rhodococcus sp. 1R11]|uniref:hypothetical protein n=1 Tax=Rhodococcus sp. 1R11 TaxID=2559614 RepID=UPI0014315E5E|nr:hypothetical protein [Rhodococcus sp. 1R11]